ncbi:uncharacterized protein AB675_1905 [Cyphellophora attinorum]|uniref:Mitochondrial carrier n=1 Tax=Cyphellophora attinorum TaxID=1664694 RepID=A0A0N0NPE0_9EURO|nr:uncharacterized protein AB675_1905 [Phialophora attinorum]KPI42641.1 hypothetical protein AB675_1905 [Phialophora attinorum]
MPGLDDTDPTDFEGIEGIGILPVTPPGHERPRKEPRNNAATGASAAGVRAFTAQAVAFYFRAPVKAFFRTRVDYLAYARSLNPHAQSGKFSWRATTPGILAYAVRQYGWKVIPDQILPPLLANATIGAALYTSYLQVLGRLHEPSSKASKVVYPPPSPTATFSAGFLAGGIQSFIAAPLDALQVRFDRREGQHYNGKTVWQYSHEKLREIGMRGIFAGWGLSFVKDSLGSGIFFCTFEYTKSQAYYRFLTWYYGSLGEVALDSIASKKGRLATAAGSSPTAPLTSSSSPSTIRPHFALEPSFLFAAGIFASLTQQTILHPLTNLQTHHYARLEHLDSLAKQYSSTSTQPSESRGRMLRAYYRAYLSTLRETRAEAASAFPSSGTTVGMWRYLYRNFWWNTLRQVPSTSAGLIIFELVRRRYGFGGGEVRIQLEGTGWDVLVS